MIGTLAGARKYGADPQDDVAVTDALAQALERVERYTGDRFSDLPATAVIVSLHDGVAWTPARLRAVQQVEADGNVLTATGWRAIPKTGVVSPATDYIGVEVARRGFDWLVAGAEPWNGGYANLLGDVEWVTITGDWGWPEAEVPGEVVEAVERLAGRIASKTYVPQADAEGNPQGYPAGPNPGDDTDPPPEAVSPAGRTERTTGDAKADRLLEPFRRRTFRIA